jgi:hypothetical protein
MTSTIAAGWKGLPAVQLVDAGVTRRQDGLVRVPYRLVDGSEHNAKLFAADGRTWWEQRGLGVVPFGLERIASRERRQRRLLWIAEGESDCLALRDRCASYAGYPVDVIALPGASTWRDEWRRHVEGYSGLLLFPDGDPAGDAMARSVQASLRWALHVRLPRGADVRAVLQGVEPELLDHALRDAVCAMVLLAGLRVCKSIADLERWLSEVAL